MSTPERSSADELLRKYATQATAALAVVVGVTGVMMFFHLAKPQVEPMHEWLGMVFAAVAVLHALRHRRAFAAMLEQPRMRAISAVTVAAAIAFLAFTPSKPANPFRMATEVVVRAPLADLAPLLGVSQQELTARLHSAGIAAADPHHSIESLAQAQGTDRIHLLAAVLGAPK